MKRRYLYVGLVGLAVLLTGCNLKSDPSLLNQAVVSRTLSSSGLGAIESSLQGMADVTTYEMKGSIDVATGQFVRDVDFYGTVALPDQVSMDQTIGGANYLLYQSGDFAYYNEDGKWKPSRRVTDLKPWDSMATLLSQAPPKRVYRLPDTTVVSWMCKVYQFRTIAKPTTLDLGGTLGGARTIPHSALYTIYLDAHSGRLRQIVVQSTIGVPGLGTSSLTATLLLFGFNKKVNMNVPNDLLAQIERPRVTH